MKGLHFWGKVSDAISEKEKDYIRYIQSGEK